MFNKKTKKNKRLVKGGATECYATKSSIEHYSNMKNVLKELSGGTRRNRRRKKMQKGGVASIMGPFSVSDAFSQIAKKGCEWVAVKGASFGEPKANATKALDLMVAERTKIATKCSTGVNQDGGRRNRKTKTRRRKNSKLIKKKRTRTAHKKKRKRKKLGGMRVSKWFSTNPCYS